MTETVKTTSGGEFDLEDRLLNLAVRVIRVARSVERSAEGRYVADQFLRSGTSPYGHHGEAEGAESREDFIHKLRVCYKELREARRWLRLIGAVPLVTKPERLKDLHDELDALVRIFSASIRTAERNHGKRGGRLER